MRLRDFGWYSDNSDGHTHPVGQKLPNAFGLFDMHGNVREWSWKTQGPYQAGPMVIDPHGKAGRGG